MYKSIILFFLLSVTGMGLSSCEKEEPVPVAAQSTIEGLWIGTYTNDAAPGEGSKYFSFIIKPGGQLMVESNSQGVRYLAFGTWTLNGKTLSCDYTYPAPPQGFPVRQTATADFDKQEGKLTSGVWTNVTNPGGTGKFTMDEVK